MHAPSTAVVRGYYVVVLYHGHRQVIKNIKKWKKSPASFHKECGLWLHWLLTIISVCDVNPCQAGLALPWVTIQKYRTSKRALKIMKMALLFDWNAYHLQTIFNNLKGSLQVCKQSSKWYMDFILSSVLIKVEFPRWDDLKEMFQVFNSLSENAPWRRTPNISFFHGGSIKRTKYGKKQ